MMYFIFLLNSLNIISLLRLKIIILEVFPSICQYLPVFPSISLYFPPRRELVFYFQEVANPVQCTCAQYISKHYTNYPMRYARIKQEN